jgi:hypothetical protein
MSASSQTAMATPPKTPLGDFHVFPREIRDMIWKNFTPQWGSNPDEIELLFRDPEQDPQNNQAILRTSHELSGEVLPYLYKKEILCFRVHGDWEQPIVVSNRKRARWEYVSIGGNILQSFRELPYERLNGIRIEIVAPDVADPGQYIFLWKRVQALVDVLSQSEGLPQIEIHLVEDPSPGMGLSKWSYDGRLRRSINNIPLLIGRGSQYAYDYDGILMPFCRLHNVPKATIFVPEDFDREREEFMLKNVESIMEWQPEPFDNVLDFGPDIVTQRYLDNTYISFEDSLDSLPGRTAVMLRLHRYSTWHDSNGNG